MNYTTIYTMCSMYYCYLARGLTAIFMVQKVCHTNWTNIVMSSQCRKPSTSLGNSIYTLSKIRYYQIEIQNTHILFPVVDESLIIFAFMVFKVLREHKQLKKIRRTLWEKTQIKHHFI